MMAEDRVSKWIPESDPATLRRIGKTGEETAELGNVCCRIIIQGINDTDPKTGKTNRLMLLEEMADVDAQLFCTKRFLKLTSDELNEYAARWARKVGYMEEWEAKFREKP